ncbi:MAG: Crp/Fnr family transcriptional regulator [Roseburia sp.]
MMSDLEKNRLFRGIKDESLSRMLTCSKAVYKKYKKDRIIFEQGDKIEELFVLLKGRVSIFRSFASGKKHILYELDAGSTFGENCFLDETESQKYSALAITDAEIIQIPWRFFSCFCDEACEHHQQLVRNMLGILSNKEQLAVKKLNIVSSTSLKERISTWLLEEADEEGIVRLRMKREQLAEYLGVARPSLSRALMKLQEEGLIELQRNYIKIKDYKKITNFL